MRRETGCILIGYAPREGPEGTGEFATYVDPLPDAPLRAGDAVLLVGTLENTWRFHHWFGAEQAR